MLVPQLAPIEAHSIEQNEGVAQLRERFLEALDSYNQFVSCIRTVGRLLRTFSHVGISGYTYIKRIHMVPGRRELA